MIAQEGWILPTESLPELHAEVEVLCTMFTKAKLIQVEPTPLWEQVADAPMQIDLKLWKKNADNIAEPEPAIPDPNNAA